MNRDQFNNLASSLGLKMFYREDFDSWPLKLRIFCSEDQRFLVEDFINNYMPVYVWVKIITEFYDYRTYTLPAFTFRDHLKDCFGWLYGDRS